MKNNEMITVPDEYKVNVSSPEYHIPRLIVGLGESALRREVAVVQIESKPQMIDVVPGVTRIEPAQPEATPDIHPTDPRKIPGTDAYEQEQIRISNIARSEWVTSNAHRRN